MTVVWTLSYIALFLIGIIATIASIAIVLNHYGEKTNDGMPLVMYNRYLPVPTPIYFDPNKK
jgi:hypothetical protein